MNEGKKNVFDIFNVQYFFFVVYGKSCNMFIFSYINIHEYSGVTGSMLAFHVGGQGSNPTIDKIFHEQMEHIFIKLCPAKVVLRLFSAISTYMSTVV